MAQPAFRIHARRHARELEAVRDLARQRGLPSKAIAKIDESGLRGRRLIRHYQRAIDARSPRR